MKPEHITQKILEEAMGRKGFAYFTKSDKPYNLNLVAIRHADERVTNKFDDVYTVSWFWQGKWYWHAWAATTDPGHYYARKALLNPAGVAILPPGQYRGAWQLGTHRGSYRALIQRKAVPVFRDKNKDEVMDMDPATIDVGWHGINHHRAELASVAQLINKYSAGCQVIQDSAHFATLIDICDRAAGYFGNAFSYTLLREDEVFG